MNLRDRFQIGVPFTVGELRTIIACFSDDCPLVVRNAPRATFYYWRNEQGCIDMGHIEIEIPDIE